MAIKNPEETEDGFMGVKVIKPPTDNLTMVNRSFLIDKFSPNLFVGDRKGNHYSALLHFNLLPLPAFLEITSAVFTIHVAENRILTTPKQIHLFQVLSPWKRGLQACRDTLLSPRPIAAATLHREDTALDFDITELTCDWYTGRAANLGLAVKLQCPGSHLLLYSSHHPNSQLWPALAIHYSNPLAATDTCGPIPIDITTQVWATSNLQFTTPAKVLIYDYAYLIANAGSHPAVVFLQVSPDKLFWETSSAHHIIEPGQLVALCPNTTSKFARIAYQTAKPEGETTLKVALQGRT